MTRNPATVPMIENDAADWFALKRSGAMTAQELLAFQAWLDAAPEHRDAFAEAERSWAVAGLLREDPQLMLLRAQARRGYPAFPLKWAAAALVVALALGIGWQAAPRLVAPTDEQAATTPLAPARQQAFHTGVGQRTTVNLSDGSVVTLDTDTVLRTKETAHERRMYLDRGRAFFKVAKDASRPFVVEAAGRTVTAVGTAFDVRVGKDQFEVTLVEGKVKVEQPRAFLRPTQSAELKAGYRIEASTPRDWTVAPADVAKETSWTKGRLTFVDDPLAEVAAELNRYSERKIILKDPEVGREPVVAVFRPGDLESFVKMVERYDLAKVTVTDGAVELSALAPDERKNPGG